MHPHTNMHAHKYTGSFTNMHTCMYRDTKHEHEYTYTSVCADTQVCVCTHIYVCISHAHIHINTHVYTYIYTHVYMHADSPCVSQLSIDVTQYIRKIREERF